MKAIIFSKTEISAIIEIKKIVEKHDIKYFKITNTTVYYKNGGLKYYINKNINDHFIDDNDNILESDYTDKLIYTDDIFGDLNSRVSGNVDGSGEEEVNVDVEVAKTSDEDGGNSEQLINKNSLSKQDHQEFY
ncbi:unnamed protein product [Rhizophagus irregularis]|uniref:Uncharacterized protein n=1 Tax=Rhizophagus irregularis TaxID=588596 RepID=A0A2N1M525_9GLOM|nr:hypothetical protein RhiirC2_799460 [Rhizophagus irregularis]CAB4401900.1 unnamed protein product [Rhizophagus irregularis]